ncbi:unnamed protein product [Cladocopium goreaui]|uniref:Pentatricopeptide repeat-containing protein At2g18940, chloroplastic n=1 Tax=Cladocopium goreaui TaxID=2562237 RepID=A0A9P1CSI9_9DINO|nr:unnamed protein product [Cladocopium goreaui]
MWTLGSSPGSLRLLSLCEEAAVRPDLVLCNIFLDNCQRQLLWQRAMWLLEEMPSKLNIQPDEVSYNSAINALELSKKSWPLAVQLLQKMRTASSLKPSIISYNCTMAATEKSSMWERTLSLWESLHEDGLVPSKAGPIDVTGDVVLLGIQASGYIILECPELNLQVLGVRGDQEAVLPSAAARLSSSKPVRLSLCHLAWQEMTGKRPQ